MRGNGLFIVSNLGEIMIVMIKRSELLTGDVRTYVGHPKERRDMFPIDVHRLLLVAAGVDENF